MTDTSKRHEILWAYREEVAARLNRLGRKAAKLGLPFGYTFEGPTRQVEEKRVEEDTGRAVPTGRVISYGDVILTVPVIALPGWTFLGTLTPVPCEEGEPEMLAFAAPGQTVPPEARAKGLRCDHCQTVRRRAETFVVQHDSGEVKVVGRQCLRDFLGHDAERIPALFAFLRSLDGALSEPDGLRGGAHREAYDLTTLLAATSAVIRAEGWVSKGYARKVHEEYGRYVTPTASHVGDYLWGTSRETAEFRRKVGPVTEQDKQDAETAVEWWQANMEESDYAVNASMIARAGLVPERAFGLAISLMPSWRRNIARQQQRAAEKQERAAAPPWTKGRQQVEGVVLSEKETVNDWGHATKWLLAVDDGRRLWLTAPAALLTAGAKVSDRVRLTVTVEPKPDDPAFAFGSRPAAGVILTVAA